SGASLRARMWSDPISVPRRCAIRLGRPSTWWAIRSAGRWAGRSDGRRSLARQAWTPPCTWPNGRKPRTLRSISTASFARTITRPDGRRCARRSVCPPSSSRRPPGRRDRRRRRSSGRLVSPIVAAAHEMTPFDPLPNHEAWQPQGQLANPFGEGNGQRNVRRQSEQRAEHNKAALEGAQRSRHQERRRIDAGAEAFEHEGVGHAERPAQEMHYQPDLARAGGPPREAKQAGAQDGEAATIGGHDGLVDR